MNQIIKNKIINHDNIIPYSYLENCQIITHVEIPNTITKIGKKAFKGCLGLKEINLPDKVSYIAEHAFSNCYSITSLTIPPMIDVLNIGVFMNCKGLETVKFNDNLIIIMDYAFDGCCNLTGINIPTSVKQIGKSFQNCNKLENVKLEHTGDSFQKLFQEIKNNETFKFTQVKYIIDGDNNKYILNMS